MISVITVSHNNENDIDELLYSIREKFKFDYEIIIVDNCNNGNKLTNLCKKHSIEKYTIVKNIRRRSFSTNNNIGVSIASSNKVLLLNPDIVIYDDSVNRLIKYNLKNKIYYPLLLNKDLSEQIYFGNKPFAFIQLINLISKFILKKRIIIPKKTTWFYAAAIFISKNSYYDIGGFDEHFPLYAEDTEFCDRAMKNGYELVKSEEIKLIHKLGGDAKGKHIIKAIISNIILRYKLIINNFNKRRLSNNN